MLLFKSYFRLHKIPFLLAVTSLLFYLSFAYDLARTDYIKLIMLYAALFVVFYKIIKINKHKIVFLTVIAFVFRFIFLFSIPNLSQDFYRFIWDGRMILKGLNPYLYTPESFISKGTLVIYQAQELYNGMGPLNGSHFTNYPPLNQLCFVLAGIFASKSILGSVMVMRLLIIAADFGTLYFGKQLLEKLNIPVHHIFWYILNPFIIIELTGNLHFESVMIFFLIWSLYLFETERWKTAALIMACSISVKLIPLMFLPLFYQKLGWKKSILFYAIVCVTTVLFFLPFYTLGFLTNYSQTVALWFQKFEFNASFYYIAREIGYWFRGYNEIETVGKIVPVLVILFILFMVFLKKNKTTIELITNMLLVLSFYYFTSTTVHPWYLATLLMLSVFTKYKFPLVWSFAAILSYLAYANTNNTENLWIVLLEYSLVYSMFFWEVFIKKAAKMAT